MLRCDLVVSADGGQWGEEQPSLMTGLRGICSLQIDVAGAAGDLHSGTYGGTIANPIHALARIIDSMHDAGGRVAVDGFYDGVRAPSQAERARISEIPYDESEYKRQIGVPELTGEEGYSTYERAWTRPTLEVNGIWGGFQEEGIKTVLPNRAHAKITCRLVPDQVPEEVVARVVRHVKTHVPRGVTVSIRPLDSRADPYSIPGDHPGNLAAGKVLQAVYGKSPYHVRMGGTIPVCGIFLKHLAVHTVIFAFGLKDENIHAPDEFFRLSSFERGKRAYGLLLKTLVVQQK
jgi:acetylornithine deacetylase/succinyl-diaminopimelate desuccinylase-like protein